MLPCNVISHGEVLIPSYSYLKLWKLKLWKNVRRWCIHEGHSPPLAVLALIHAPESLHFSGGAVQARGASDVEI
jgi:hypothetical protein